MKRISWIVVVLIVIISTGWAQTKSTTSPTKTVTAQPKCPAVTPQNAQEALTMEQSTNKIGCWVRNPATGKLEFIGNSPADYKPLLPNSASLSSSGRGVFRDPTEGIVGHGEFVGQWAINAQDASDGDIKSGKLIVKNDYSVSATWSNTQNIMFGIFLGIDAGQAVKFIRTGPSSYFSYGGEFQGLPAVPMPRFSSLGNGIYVARFTYGSVADFHVNNDPKGSDYRNVTMSVSYKFVVVGDMLKGSYTRSENPASIGWDYDDHVAFTGTRIGSPSTVR